MEDEKDLDLLDNSELSKLEELLKIIDPDLGIFDKSVELIKKQKDVVEEKKENN